MQTQYTSDVCIFIFLHYLSGALHKLMLVEDFIFLNATFFSKNATPFAKGCYIGELYF